MTDDSIVLKVAARFQKQADQPPGARSKARKLTAPINPPKGIDKGIVKDNGATDNRHLEAEDTGKPDKRDITPKDVFNLTPNNAGVLNFAETGKDLQKAIDTQIPKDKGHDTVKNLSQYLIRTEGGGDTPPAGKGTPASEKK